MSRKAPTTGAELRALRGRLDVSQAQLARDWGVSPRMIRKLESSDELPKGYRHAARELAGGRTVAPERRTTATGAPVRVRAPGGRTTPVDAPRPGSDRGITYAQGTGSGAPVVRRVEQWVPYEQTPEHYRPGVQGGGAIGIRRDAAFDNVAQAVNDAHSRGQAAVVTATPDEKGAGYVLTVVGLPEGAPAPHGAGTIVIPVDGDWDEATWDELADDAGLGYGDKL